MKDIILQPPILLGILLSCIVYFIIIFNLTKDRKFAAVFEKLTIYVFTFIISGANFFPFDRLDPSDIGDPAKGIFSGLFLLAVYGIFFIIFRGNRKQIINNFGYLFRQPLLGLYLGLICFSVFWSDNPQATVRATLGLLFYSMFAVHYARKYSWHELSTIFRWNSVFIALFSVLSAVGIPSIGVCPKGWCGGFGHPIDLGVLMVMGIALWMLNAIFAPRYRLRSCLFTALCILVMQMTSSAGSFMVFITLVIIVLTTTFLKKLNFTQALIFFVMMLFSFGFAIITILANLENVLSALNKDITLTGRIPLWNLLMQRAIPERPWFGYGFNGYWQRWRGNDSPAADIVKIIIGDGRDWVAHAHNGFLDIVLNLGLIGLGIFTILFFINLFKTIRLVVTSRRSESFLPLIILTSVFITNLFNSPIVIPSLIWFQFVIVTIKLNVVSTANEGKTSSLKDNHLRSATIGS